MTSGAAKRLTDRQRAVMERIDRRVPIKVIASEPRLARKLSKRRGRTTLQRVLKPV